MARDTTTLSISRKLVSAAVAAETLGGCSLPYLCSNGYALIEGDEYALSCFKPEQVETERRKAQEVLDKIEEAEALDLPLLWCANHSFGGRRVETSADSVVKIDDWGMNSVGAFWEGFDMREVELAEYTSATSGARLCATRLKGGAFLLEYAPPVDNPEYRGSYYQGWEEAEGDVLPSLDFLIPDLEED